METKIFIRQVHTDPKTGHIKVRVQSETSHEGATWTGPVADYGVDAITFFARFGKDIDQLEAYFASEHRAKIGIHEDLAGKLAERVGKQIG